MACSASARCTGCPGQRCRAAESEDDHDLGLFEVSWLVPLDRVTEQMRSELATKPLNLDAEIKRWGADLVGMA